MSEDDKLTDDNLDALVGMVCGKTPADLSTPRPGDTEEVAQLRRTVKRFEKLIEAISDPRERAQAGQLKLLMVLMEENDRLRERLHEQTQQTQGTATQIRQAVLDAIERHGGLPEGVGLDHPIEQIVGSIVAKLRGELAEVKFALAAVRNTKFRIEQYGDFWIWQNDGEDHLESMSNSMLVAIRAPDLKRVFGELAEWKQLAAERGETINRFLGELAALMEQYQRLYRKVTHGCGNL